MDTTTLNKSIKRQQEKVGELRQRTAAAQGIIATEAYMRELDQATQRLEDLHRMHDSALIRARFNG